MCTDFATVTQACIVGASDVDLRYELLSRETSRAALATYDLHEPYENTIAVDTVSLGAAVSLLNDLNWYLVRFADAALIREPSISTTEWLRCTPRESATPFRSTTSGPSTTTSSSG
jgi:hypothetical protein